MGSVLGVVGEGVDCAPCVRTLSAGKEGLMALRTRVPNFLLLAALTLGFFFFDIGVVPGTYTTGYLFSIQSETAKFHCDIKLLTSRIHRPHIHSYVSVQKSGLLPAETVS